MFVEMVVSACYAFARILSLEDTVTLIIIIIAPKTRWLSKPQHSILFRVLSVSVVLFTVDESYIHTESEPTRHNSILPIPHFKVFHFGVWDWEKKWGKMEVLQLLGVLFTASKLLMKIPLSDFIVLGCGWSQLVQSKILSLWFSGHPFAWFDGILFLEVVVDQVRSLGKYLISYRLLLMMTNFRCALSFPCL